jgi:PAS domain S-box-containing protein
MSEDELEGLREVGRFLLDPELAMRIIDDAAEAMVIVRSNCTIFFINHAAENITGYSRVELYDRDVNILVPDALKERHTRHMTQYLADPKTRAMGLGLTTVPVNLALELKTKSGELCAIDASLHPITVEQGFFVVVTVRKRLTSG